MQCRITTEDPANGFRPDTGRITRLPLARRCRASGWTAATHLGAEISAHFDSMLVKLTCRGRDFAAAVAPGPARASPSSASAACRRTSRSCRPCVNDPDFRAGPGHHVVHRRAPVPADRTHPGRPRHQDPHLPRRGHGQPAARPAAVGGRPAGQTAADSICDAAPPRHQAAAGRAGTRGLRPLAARIARPSASPTRPSATRTSRCWPPGSAPAAC